MLLATACDSRPEAPRTDAREAYLHYCASCHGLAGKGDGPLAGSLTRKPTDLTRIAHDTGRFDEATILATILGRRDVAEHGPRDMPVWGDVFKEELDADDRSYPLYTALLTAQAMTDYLRALQEQ